MLLISHRVLLLTNSIFQFIGNTNTTSWYEFSSTDHPLAGDCSSIDFTRVGNAVTVLHQSVRQNFLSDYHGTASLAASTARLTLNMPTVSNLREYSAYPELQIWINVERTIYLSDQKDKIEKDNLWHTLLITAAKQILIN